jgi:hypothetical protein
VSNQDHVGGGRLVGSEPLAEVFTGNADGLVGLVPGVDLGVDDVGLGEQNLEEIVDMGRERAERRGAPLVAVDVDDEELAFLASGIRGRGQGLCRRRPRVPGVPRDVQRASQGLVRRRLRGRPGERAGAGRRLVGRSRGHVVGRGLGWCPLHDVSLFVFLALAQRIPVGRGMHVQYGTSEEGLSKNQVLDICWKPRVPG